jgi:hypothetical protein
MLIIFLIVISFCCHSSMQVFDDANDINGYYFGSDKSFTSVFVRLAGDTAFADFILFQKYPRDLLTDTLLWEPGNRKFFGHHTFILQKDKNYFVYTNENSMVFDKQLSIKIKPNESYYKNYLNEYKNSAFLYKYYKEYLKSKENKEEARKQFQKQLKEYGFETMMDTLNHKAFIEEVEKFKTKLHTLGRHP